MMGSEGEPEDRAPILTKERIDWLVREYLERVGGGGSGCDTLLLDHRDGRLWELTCPDGWPHGGGAPRLTWISLESARRKYG
jgi:hypothetical protein